jgi:quinol monooxygenase YgiN
MGILVITCFKPKEGKDRELLEVVSDHMPVLRKENLVTERECYVMKSKDGCIIEVFEWKSQEAINSAHENKNVHLLWKRFEEVCEYKTLSDLEESKNLFPGFEPVL